MSDSQIEIPESFIRLYLDPGRIKPRESRAFIAQRYDLCEDMAQMLIDPARETLWKLSITEWDVLQRMQQGLIGGEVNLSLAESQWVALRLAELLGWNADGLFD